MTLGNQPDHTRLASTPDPIILIRVHIHRDPDTKTYWADSPDLDGLTVAGHTLDEVRREVVLAADSLLDLALKSTPG